MSTETEGDRNSQSMLLLIVASDSGQEQIVVCREWAAGLADETGLVVQFVSVPALELEGVTAQLDSGRRAETCYLKPRLPVSAPMSAAPFVWRADGRPDWSAMWTSFCDLALYGGPPQRGEDSALLAPQDADGKASATPEMIAELRRGIWEVTGLFCEPAEAGWIAITCNSRQMAAWMCAAIILENVDAKCDGDRLLVPAGPNYQLKEEVKSIITVVAKTHHYWQSHVVAGREGASAAGAGSR